MTIQNFSVNGKPVSVEAPNDMALLWVLRDKLGITGPKYGCGLSQCGACTVIIDGQAVRSCVTSVGSVVGSRRLAGRRDRGWHRHLVVDPWDVKDLWRRRPRRRSRG